MATAMLPASAYERIRPLQRTGPGSKGYDLWARYQALVSERNPFETDWQDLVELVMPGAADITTQRSKGNQRTERLFDTTAIMASQTLAANMMGSVTNPAIQWFRLGFRDKGLGDDQEVSTWLNDVDEILLGAYNASNFYQACHTYYLCLGVFGTAAMYVGTQLAAQYGRLESRLRFRTLATGSYAIAENADGRVDTLFRTLELSPRQALQMFEGNVSDQMRQMAEQPGSMDKPQEFLHCVYPRSDVSRGARQDNQAMPYASVYMECKSRHVNDESGYEEFPFLVSRWETIGTAPYGFGPGHMALPDISTLNALKELNLRQLMLWVQPPLMMMQEGVLGAISLQSLAVNVMQGSMDNLKAMELNGRPDLVAINQEDLRKAIRDIFFADTLTGLPPAEASTMTAYEVAQRIEMMSRLMGPAFTRLLSEMLDPLADRVFGLLWRAGVLPPVPLAIVRAARQNQGQLDVEYEGPLARAQRGTEVKAMSELLSVAAQISAGMGGSLEIYDNLDLDLILHEVAKANGTPRHVIVDAYKVMQTRKARQQQQQQMAQAAMQNQQADSLGKLAPVMSAMNERAA